MNGELPEGWAHARLNKVVNSTLGGDWGKEPDKMGKDFARVRVIRGTDFRTWARNRATGAAERCIKVSSLEKRKLRKGDLVLEVSGGGPDQPVGRTVLIDDDALSRIDLPLVCSNFFRQLRLDPQIDPNFVSHSLDFAYKRGAFNEFQTQTTNLRNLNVNDFLEGTEISLAPLAEQRRIVAKLEKILGQVDACQQRLTKIPILLKRFRQSVLAAACSGRLTADWREENPSPTMAALLAKIEQERVITARKLSSKRRTEPAQIDTADLPDIPENWQWATLDQIVEEGRPIIYGIIKPGPHDPKGVPYVRVFEMKDGKVVPLSELRRASLERASKFTRATLKAGDLLISKDGTIGRVAIVPPELEGGNITQHLVRASVHSFLNREYIACAIRSQHSQNWLVDEKKGVALQGVNVEDFRRLPLPIPPQIEQQEIVRRVEKLFSLADRLEERFMEGQKRVQGITQSLLAKAFRGELVPTEFELAKTEGRSFESAEELLERIRKERQSSEKKAKLNKLKKRTRAVAELIRP